MRIRAFNRRILLSIILSWLIPALACNFPFNGAQTNSTYDLRKTLTALSPLIPVGETPVPVEDENQGVSRNGGVPTESGPTISYQKPKKLRKILQLRRIRTTQTNFEHK